MSVSLRPDPSTGPGRAAQTRRNRVAGAKKAAATSRRLRALRDADDAAREETEALPGTGPRGEGMAMGWSPGEVIARILGRLRDPSTRAAQGEPE